MNLSIFKLAAVAIASCLAASHVPAADTLTLLPGDGPGKFLVPSDSGLGTNWIAPGFSDSNWSNVVSGVGFDLPKAPILPAGIIADSMTEFSGVQGASNWFYGYWDKGNDSDGSYQSQDFTAFPREAGNNTPGNGNYWDGAKWDWFAGNPPWDELSATGGRPNGANNGSAHYVIRRWVSEINGLVHLVGNISNSGACGDGVDLRIWVDGVEVLGLAPIFGTPMPFAANVEVQIGSTVDFGVGPNAANDLCDAFDFHVKILQNTLADAAEDFSGMQGARGWRYGYYNKTADGDGSYNAATDFTEADPNFVFNGAWTLGPGDPPWTRLGATDMRPNSTPEHWPIRRYISTYSGLVRIAGALTIFQGCGGGTRARLFVDGVQVYSRELSQISVGYSVLAQVSVGSKLDFALDPNGDDSCDDTTWTALIQPAAVSTMLVADSEAEFSGVQGQENWFYGFYDRTADSDGIYNPLTDFSRVNPDWAFGGSWTLGPADPPMDLLGRLETYPNGTNNGAEHWMVRRWVSKRTGAIDVDWHFSKSSLGGNGATMLVLLNGQQMDSASIAGDNLTGVSHVISLLVRKGDFVEFVHTPLGPAGDRSDTADGCLFDAHIYSHSYNPEGICVPVADSQADWSATGQLGYRGWRYGFYNKSADIIPGYQAENFTPFPHNGAGWGPSDFWDGVTWNANPDPVPWDTIGQTLVIPNGTNSFLPEEHWVIRRWASTAKGTLRVDWFTRKVNPFGNGVTGKIFHKGVEMDSAATATQTGFHRTVSFSGVAVGDVIDLPLTPVGPNSDGDDGADGSDNGMTIYSCTNVIDYVRTDVASRMQYTNSSAYLRLPFAVADVSCLDQVRLRIQYDDGFVAWLNGVEIARRNAPASPAPAWNARATAACTTAQSIVPEVIDITAFKSALVSGQNVLAIHGLNRCIDDADFLIAPEITATVLPPEIVGQPLSRTNLVNETASFHVQVHTCADVSYQWRSNGVPIAGETADQLFIEARLENQAGYDVVISNADGSTTSVAAILTVNRHPLAFDHGVATPMNTSVLLPGRKLLNDVMDPDGDPFALISIGVPQHGSALLSGGNVFYTPPPGFTGNDMLTFSIADNRGGSATAAIQVFVYSGVLPSQNQVVIQSVSGGQRVRFAGVPGKNYAVQRATSLTQPMDWTTLNTMTAPTYGLMEYTDLNNLPQAFYRTIPAP